MSLFDITINQHIETEKCGDNQKMVTMPFASMRLIQCDKALLGDLIMYSIPRAQSAYVKSETVPQVTVMTGFNSLLFS